MTRRDWWIGILLLVAAVIAHAAMNRYSWHLAVYDVQGRSRDARVFLAIDRLTGAVTYELVPDLDEEALYAERR